MAFFFMKMMIMKIFPLKSSYFGVKSDFLPVRIPVKVFL
ncbi:hypothetical protein V4_1264 [Lactococcus cremoris]|nr:hypothetical protein V4_1264 [Lactococcus cremoris]